MGNGQWVIDNWFLQLSFTHNFFEFIITYKNSLDRQHLLMNGATVAIKSR